MTDANPHAIDPIDGWIPHDNGPAPVPGDTVVDLRFHGYDAIRTPPYIRYHEMWEQEADTVRWTLPEQMYGHHHSAISHWRRSSWRDGRNEHGNLRSDPYVAFRLTMGDDRRAPLGALLAAWNALAPQSQKVTLADLPADMTRVGVQVVCDTQLEPIVLTFDQAVTEALRLSGEHRPANAGGWHRMSNVARVMGMLTGKRDMRTIGATHANVADALRAHILLEIRNDGADVLLRPLDPAQVMLPVTTRVVCPGDRKARELPDAATFGIAFRTLRDLGTALVATGTEVTFTRGAEQRQAIWSQERGDWITPDGRPLLRSDASDPVLHHYRNGHMVGTKIGFVSASRTGAFFANVGIPHDSEGDEDAHIMVTDRMNAKDQAEAEALLAARDDIDHILPGVTTYNGQMGFWLTAMGR